MKHVIRNYTPITHFAAKTELYSHYMNRRHEDLHYNDTVWLKRGIHYAIGIRIEEREENYKRALTYAKDPGTAKLSEKTPVYEVKVYEQSE